MDFLEGFWLILPDGFREVLLNSTFYVNNCPNNSVTKAIISIIAAVLFFLVLNKKSIKFKTLGFNRLGEFINWWFNKQLNEKIPFDKSKFFLIFYLIFLFIWFSNFIGLVPFCDTVTVFLIVNLFFSFMVQITLTVLSLYLYGFDTIKMFIPTGVPLLVAFFLLPIEIVSYLSRIISLAVRLFANMFAGHCVLQILSVFMVSTITFLGWGSPIFIFLLVFVFILIFLLEFVVSFLQAFVFLSLVVIYLNINLNLH